MLNLEHAIRERAYHLWVADGCRDGAADAYWLSAQRELLNASMSVADTETELLATEVVAAKKMAPAKAKAKVEQAKAATPAKPKRRAA
jgi:hypothetical protein